MWTACPYFKACNQANASSQKAPKELGIGLKLLARNEREKITSHSHITAWPSLRLRLVNKIVLNIFFPKFLKCICLVDRQTAMTNHQNLSWMDCTHKCFDALWIPSPSERRTTGRWTEYFLHSYFIFRRILKWQHYVASQRKTYRYSEQTLKHVNVKQTIFCGLFCTFGVLLLGCM